VQKLFFKVFKNVKNNNDKNKKNVEKNVFTSMDKTNKNWQPRHRPLGGWKTIISNFAKICPVDVEIMGLKGIVKIRNSSRT